MNNFQETYRRWTDRFWERFSDLTGWDPTFEQQLQVLTAAFTVLFLAFLLLYVHRITRKTKRAATRDRMIADYQQMRRYQSANDR